ncbi:aminotransferase [Halobacteriovorax sp. BALOs_7]|uniref:DegT/DnrJ/EryC1/StrS family aminotransferase n=1 Tax=Halobacteriovorax vibrionivorans TaxID=2152716 RepID=A0ABY0IPB9_9BACT|nr:aminotransferase [Halobacteriovorax sp. BALOs_7]RZF23304.1 DegT/DnrJ/EryC1/StrS family aminotransferase [Halobacteriovorax vibrionivorans]TGD49342.1 DegT/DnrJ/EryC1/StrS family aminotransferase [Halobacteriovorax sp. Y22]
MIPFLDIKKQNLKYKDELIKAFNGVLESGYFINGDQVKEFEESFSKITETRYCVGTSNGLDSLVLCILAWKEIGFLKSGDEVIVPANTFIATILAISSCGLKPILIEPCSKTFNITAKEIRKHISQRTKLVIVVHLYGQMANMSEISELTKNSSILLLEDSAQAHLATHRSKPAGSWGDAAAFSFYPGKNLGALGDAGAITTNNKKLYEVIKALSNYGSEKKYEHIYKGRNNRLDEIQAAFLNVKLRYLNDETITRQNIAKRYSTEITNPLITLPHIAQYNIHVWHLYVIKTNHREELIEHLRRNNVNTLIHYPIPIHKQKAYKEISNLHLPITESLHNKVLSIPIDPNLTVKDIDQIIESINSFKL